MNYVVHVVDYFCVFIRFFPVNRQKLLHHLCPQCIRGVEKETRAHRKMALDATAEETSAAIQGGEGASSEQRA
jgi:type II secretory ATPase GspE/PulE/Tfp pilus assembly ATPase PilB-like protein